jgi:hypothetical protein
MQPLGGPARLEAISTIDGRAAFCPATWAKEIKISKFKSTYACMHAAFMRCFSGIYELETRLLNKQCLISRVENGNYWYSRIVLLVPLSLKNIKSGRSRERYVGTQRHSHQ